MKWIEDLIDATKKDPIAVNVRVVLRVTRVKFIADRNH